MKILLDRLPALFLTIWFCLTSFGTQGAILVQVGHNLVATTATPSSPHPPDPNGAIGPAHYVQFINGTFSIFDKLTGTNIQTMSDASFWASAGVALGPVSISDPRTLYDRLTQRWFASQIDFDPNNLQTNRFLLAVSATADPTGTWNGVAFPADKDGNFADFPTLGVDASGVYLGGNLFDTGQNFLGVNLVSLPKADLLQVPPVANNRTYSGLMSMASWGFTLQPVNDYAPTNNGGMILAVSSDGTDFVPHSTLKTFRVQAAGTPLPAFGPSQNITVPAFNVPINPPQPNNINSLDDGDSRIGSCVHKVGDTVYAVHGTQIGSRAGIRWYRISASDNSLLEAGTISDPNLDLFYPSIAANELGHIVIGFNGSSETNYISSYAAVGETINGSTVFGDKQLLAAGFGTYDVLDPNGDNRWGDYSATSADPVAPGHFWTLQMIPATQNVWSTHLTELIVTTLPSLTVAGSGTNLVLSWPTNSIGFALESTPDVTPPAVWTPVTNSVVTGGGLNTVTVSRSPASQFFHLKK